MNKTGHRINTEVQEKDTLNLKNIKTEKFDILTDIDVHPVIPKLESFETGRVEEVFCRETTANENPCTATNEIKSDRNIDYKSLKNEPMVDTGSLGVCDAVKKQQTSDAHNRKRKKSRGTFRHAVKTIGHVEHHPVLSFPNSPQFLSRTSESKTLHIQNLSRPFTIEALKKILQKSGAILEESLWIDKLRTQCFVTYMDLKSAVLTRQILHGARWPHFNRQKLVVEFYSDNVSFDIENHGLSKRKRSTHNENAHNSVHSGTIKHRLKSLKLETPSVKSASSRRRRLSNVSDTPKRQWTRDSDHRLCSNTTDNTIMETSDSITRGGRVWVRLEHDVDDEHTPNGRLKSVVGYCYIKHRRKRRKLDQKFQTRHRSKEKQTIYTATRGSNENDCGNRKHDTTSKENSGRYNTKQNRESQINRKLKHPEKSKVRTHEHGIVKTARESCLSSGSLSRTGKAKQSPQQKPHTLNMTPMLKRLRLKALKRPLFESTPICKNSDGKTDKKKSNHSKGKIKEFEYNFRHQFGEYQMASQNGDVVYREKLTQTTHRNKMIMSVDEQHVTQTKDKDTSPIRKELSVLNIKQEVTMETLPENVEFNKKIQLIKQEPLPTRKPDVQLKLPPMPTLSCDGNDKVVDTDRGEFNNSFIEMACV